LAQVEVVEEGRQEGVDHLHADQELLRHLLLAVDVGTARKRHFRAIDTLNLLVRVLRCIDETVEARFVYFVATRQLDILLCIQRVQTDNTASVRFTFRTSHNKLLSGCQRLRVSYFQAKTKTHEL
jgi:hypothetical protein